MQRLEERLERRRAIEVAAVWLAGDGHRQKRDALPTVAGADVEPLVEEDPQERAAHFAVAAHARVDRCRGSSKAGFDKFVEARMKDERFAAEHAKAKREILAVDQIVRALDAARGDLAMSKAELARQAGDLRREHGIATARRSADRACGTRLRVHGPLRNRLRTGPSEPACLSPR
jgi:hypothetical protein